MRSPKEDLRAVSSLYILLWWEADDNLKQDIYGIRNCYYIYSVDFVVKRINNISRNTITG